MAQNTVLKRTRRIKVFVPDSTFQPESGINLNIVVQAGKNYQVRGKSTLGGKSCWIIIEYNSTKYDVLLSDAEAERGTFQTIEVPRKR